MAEIKPELRWTYHRTPRRHWTSSPSGYFIIKEKSLHFEDLYLVYEGSFDDWRLEIGNPPAKKGEYKSLWAARNFYP